MDARAARRDALARTPMWARGVVAYLLLLALAWLLSLLPWLDWGASLFLLGALLVLASAALVRTGGQRSVVTLRAPDGAPLKREPVAPERRRGEIRLGLFLFALAMGLWAPVVGMAVFP